MLCAKFQDNWIIETDIMDEKDFARFPTDILYCTAPLDQYIADFQVGWAIDRHNRVPAE